MRVPNQMWMPVSERLALIILTCMFRGFHVPKEVTNDVLAILFMHHMVDETLVVAHGGL